MFKMFRKIKYFFVYRSVLKSIEKELSVDYNARVDSIYRIYSVLNLSNLLVEEPYNLRKSDIDSMARPYLLEYRRNFSDFLVQRGLMELFELYEVRKVDKYSYLIIFGYSLINTKKFANNFIIVSVSILLIIVIFLIALGIFKTLV